MRRLFLFLLVILLIAGGALALFLVFGLDRYRTELADNLSQRLHHKVVIGRLSAGFIPPSLHLSEVGILNKQEAPLLQAGLIDVTVSLRDLFHGRVVPRALAIRQWQTTIHREADGRWTLDDWVAPAAQLGEQSDWPLKQLALDRGECHVTDAFGPESQELVIQIVQGEWEPASQTAMINGTLGNLPTPVNFVLQAQGTLRGTPQGSGNLQLTDDTRQWTLTFKVQGGEYHVDGKAKAWRFDNAYTLFKFYSRLPLAAVTPLPSLLLGDWESHFVWQGGALSFTHVATLSGGQVEMKARMAPKAGVTTAQMDLALAGVNVQPVEIAVWGTSPLEGTARGVGHLEVALSSSPWSGVKGQGALEIQKGRYYWPQMTRQDFSRAHIMNYLTRKFPGFPEQGLPIVKAFTHWQAQHGAFSFSDAFCTLGDLQIAAVGKFDAPRHGIDAYTKVLIHERKADLLKELPTPYVSRSDGRAIIRPIYGRLQGTPTEWRLRAVRAGKMPANILAQLRKTLTSK